MSARLLLDRLEELGLLDPSVISDLRRQVDQAGRPVAAETLAKLLVDNGHLTKFQAERLVEEVTAAREEKRQAKVESTEARRQRAEQQERKAAEEDELAELIGDLASAGGKPTSSPAAPARTTPPPARPTSTPGRAPGGAGRAEEQPAANTPAASRPQPPGTTGGRSSLPPARSTPAAAGPASQPTGLEPWLLSPTSPKGERAPGRPSRQPSAPPTRIPSSDTPGEAGAHGRSKQPRATAAADFVDVDQQDVVELPGDTADAHSVDERTATASDELFADVAPPTSPMVAKKKRLPTNPWESPFILVGGFALIVLVVLSLVMWYSLTRGTAAEYFQAAEADYRNGAYANAISKFEKFLRYFPNDPNASLARVRRYMAQLRMEAEGARDPLQGLKAAQQILPQIEKEQAFAEARAELATLLPDIARAFAERAKNATSIKDAQDLLAKVDEAMQLVNNPDYIPSTQRRTQLTVIERIEETVTQVERDIQRQQRLAKALADMDAAVAAGAPREAFRVRDQLVAEFPGLARHPDVLQRVTAIAERERDLISVKPNDLRPEPETEETSVGRVLLYSRAGSTRVPGTPDQMAIAVQGTVYAVDTGNGELAWRRFVGFHSTFTPKRLGTEPRSDWLLLDAENWRVMRVRSADGHIVWQVRFAERVHDPIVWRDRVLVTTESGRVFNMSAADGQGSQVTDFQQHVDVAAAVDDRYPVYYQVGEYDNLYVVNINTMECREVYYLGHRRGEVQVPPTLAAGLLFVSRNTGPDFSFVHVLTLDKDGLNLKEAQDPIRLEGHVIGRPLVVGRRVVFCTSLGAVTVLELNPQENPPVSQEIAPLPRTRSDHQMTYALVDGSSLWLADRRLLAYDIQASQAQLARRWVNFDGHDFVSPLVKAGEAVIAVRKPPHSSGYRIVALDGATGKNLYWQTDVGYPMLQVVAGRNGQIFAFSQSGVAYQWDASADTDRLEGIADLRVGEVSFDAVHSLPDGRYALYSRMGRALVFDPARADSPPQLVQFTLPGQSDTESLLLGDQLVIPLTSGEIVAMDLTTGSFKVAPFQPPLRPGGRVRWTSPARVADDRREFVIADDQQRLFRIGMIESGGKRLESLEQVSTAEPLRGRLAVVGGKVLGVSARSDTDVLWAFGLPRLQADSSQSVEGRVVWGPLTWNDMALLSVRDDQGREQLWAVDSPQNSRWKLPLQYGTPVGVTPINDRELLIATQGGALLRVELATGQLVAQTELVEPVGGSPVVMSDTVWLPTVDGSLLRVPLPQP